MAENNGLHVCYSISKECWNMEAWGYGICHHCECCSKDKRIRYEARARYLRERLKDLREFKGWFDDPKMKALQEKNIRADIHRCSNMLMYYRKRLWKMGVCDE